MTMYGIMPEYGQQSKPWQRLHKIPLYYNYDDGLLGNTCLLLVSMRFLRIASGMKGHYSLCKYYKRIKDFDNV
jgi:hypothetical protein